MQDIPRIIIELTDPEKPSADILATMERFRLRGYEVLLVGAGEGKNLARPNDILLRPERQKEREFF